MSSKIRVHVYIKEPFQIVDMGSLDYTEFEQFLTTWKPYTLLHIGNLELSNQCNTLIESIPVEEFDSELFRTNYPYHQLPIYTIPSLDLDTGLTDVVVDAANTCWVVGSNFTLNYTELLTLCQEKGEEIDIPVSVLHSYLDDKSKFGVFIYPEDTMAAIDQQIELGKDTPINLLLTDEEELYILSGATTLYRKMSSLTNEDFISVNLFQLATDSTKESTQD